jgi:hypothetical protein
VRLATRISKTRLRPTRLRSARGWAPAPVATDTFGTSTDLRQRVLIALEPDYSLPYWQWGWTDITEYVRWDPGINVTYGRRDENSLVASLDASMDLENDGRFSRRNPFGAYAGKLTRNTPIWASVNPGSGWCDRLYGYVNTWPKRWDSTGTDSTVPISVGGVMRRLQQDTEAKSALNRTISGLSVNGCEPLAYWTLEDGADATQFASALPGGTALQLVGPTLAVDDSLPGALALPIFDGYAYASAPLPAYTDEGRWSAVVNVYPDSPSPVSAASVISIETGVGKVAGGMLPDTDLLVLAYWDTPDFTSPSPPHSTSLSFGVDQISNVWLTLTLTSTRSTTGGADSISVTVRDRDGVELLSLSMDTAVGFHQAGTRVNVSGNRYGVGMGGTYGHVGFWANPAFTVGQDDVRIAKAMYGHVGETAPERMARECQAAQVPFYCSDSTSVTLGPQPVGTLVEVLRDGEKGDGGVLFEDRFGFGYKPLRGFYNQPVHLPLDQAAGQLAGSVEADDSDQDYINQWTASRENGSSATFRDPDYRTADGLFAGSGTYNVENDGQLPDIAGWQVGVGTIDEDRWPRIEIDLANHPELIPYWVALPFGGRTQVASPHEEVGVDQIDAIVQGWTEHWNSKLWSAAMNTTPASIYNVPTYSGGVRYGARNTVLAAAISATDTSIAVNSNGETWATTASHPTRFPANVDIGGITYSCTANTGTAPDYTLTIVRLATDRSHDAGVTVRPTDTGRYGK